MFSRLAIRSAQLRPANAVVRSTSTTPASQASESGTSDQKNLPRPVRGEPGKVRLGFLPEEWFLFFHKKTGVTGPYAFGVGLVTYLCSKEIYVMEHEYYSGLSILLMVWFATKKFGPSLGAYADKEIDNLEKEWNESRVATIKNFADSIEEEKKAQWRAEGQNLLIEAKRENVLLQLEAAYRQRIANTYSEVKRRLDYQMAKYNADRRIQQKHMVQWIVGNVLKSITPDQEKETLNRCINDLAALAVKK